MKQKIRLHIPEPCHENWDGMTVTQQGRFCNACSKEVVDFSLMTDKEIFDYISTAGIALCGRVGTGQLDRDLRSPAELRKTGWRYWTGLAATLLLFSSRAGAQVKQRPAIVCLPHVLKIDENVLATVGIISKTPITFSMIELRGKVLNDQGNPLSYASVKLGGSSIGVAADSSGNFILEVETAAAGIELAVSAVGYGSETIEIKRREAVAARAAAGIPAIVISTIVLTAVPALEEVMITANPPALHPVIAGGISVCRKVTQYEKVKSRVKEVLGTNEIKVYPNPIVKNGSFRIVFHVNNPGQYALQVTDVTGKIIYGRQITIFSKDQTEYFDASLFAGTGIYFVYITGKYNGKTYSNKLLLQY